MAVNDYAIVVGVSRYPDLGDLGGPENDALAFRAWLVDAAGGDVPEANIRLFVSSRYPTSATLSDAQPGTADIERAFDALCDVADQNNRQGKGLRVGRRLYIFLAGHGFAPQRDDAALLTANASKLRTGYHIPGRAYASWFQRAGYFSEIVLLMDCCREDYPSAPLNVPRYAALTDPDAIGKSRTFFGYATKWSRVAREKAFPPDPEIRGVFSTAVLHGLRSAIEDPATNEITATSLSNYLYNNMKDFLDPNAPRDQDQVPELVYDSDPSARFVIAKGQPIEPDVALDVGENGVGQNVEILDSRFAVIANATPCTERIWNVTLAAGLYKARIASQNRQCMFEVTGTAQSTRVPIP